MPENCILYDCVCARMYSTVHVLCAIVSLYTISCFLSNCGGKNPSASNGSPGVNYRALNLRSPLFSLSLSFLPPIILSSSNRPSLRMMRGHVRVWWQRSTAHNALCQGKIKTGQEEKHSPSDACLCVHVCVCAQTGIRYWQVLGIVALSKGTCQTWAEILINTDLNASFSTTKETQEQRKDEQQKQGKTGERET